MSSCKKCFSDLVSFSEQQSGVCSHCMITVVSELDDALDDVSSLRKKNKELNDSIEELLEKNTLYTSLMKAELEGATASRRGLLLSDNLYASGSVHNEHWAIGWSVDQLSMSLEKMRAIMLWTTEHLVHIRELAKGYGYDEIATKLDLVFQKVSPYIGEL